METIKKAEEFYNLEFNEKPARDSIFASVIGITYQDGEIANKEIHSKDELIAFAVAFANQQTTSQQQTIERLREELGEMEEWVEKRKRITKTNPEPSPFHNELISHYTLGYEEALKRVKESIQLLNTTEPIDQ